MKSGFFVSCKKGKEQKAFKELQTVLNTLFDTIEIQGDYRSLNIEEEIQNEIRIVQSAFFSIHFTYKSMLYISNTSPLLPSRLFNLLKQREIYLEYVQRIVPLDRFVSYNEDVIIKSLSDIDTSLSFKIEYEERFAPKDIKTRVFGLITDRLRNMRVCLTNPDYLIIISALKVDIGITVMKNYRGTFNFSRDANIK